MIVLADNDILLKLAGCHLLDDFLSLLKTNTDNIFITTSAKFSIPQQAKKKIQDIKIQSELAEFVGKLQILPAVDTNLLRQIQDCENIDDGEAYLMLAMHHYPNATFITGDKRCLKTLIQNQDKPPLTEIFHLLNKKVYCFESSLLYLINAYGFDDVNNKITSRCINDKVLDLAFGQGRNQEHCVECLLSYCREIMPILAKYQ